MSFLQTQEAFSPVSVFSYHSCCLKYSHPFSCTLFTPLYPVFIPSEASVTSPVRSPPDTRIKVLTSQPAFPHPAPLPPQTQFHSAIKNTHALTMHRSFTCCGCGGERLGGGGKCVSLDCQGLSGFPSEHRACSQCIKGIKARKWMVPCSHLPRGG